MIIKADAIGEKYTEYRYTKFGPNLIRKETANKANISDLARQGRCRMQGMVSIRSRELKRIKIGIRAVGKSKKLEHRRDRGTHDHQPNLYSTGYG